MIVKIEKLLSILSSKIKIKFKNCFSSETVIAAAIFIIYLSNCLFY